MPGKYNIPLCQGQRIIGQTDLGENDTIYFSEWVARGRVEFVETIS